MPRNIKRVQLPQQVDHLLSPLYKRLGVRSELEFGVEHCP